MTALSASKPVSVALALSRIGAKRGAGPMTLAGSKALSVALCAFASGLEQRSRDDGALALG